MVDHVDVVVIGAGLGGLAAAVAAAGRGRHVVVLEQGENSGGYATGFQRGPYRFDASLHALNGLAPGGGHDRLYRELGITERLHLERLDPLYLARFPSMEIVAHADRFRYESGVIERFPYQAQGVRALLDEQVAAHADARRLSEDLAAGRNVPGEDFMTVYPAVARLSGETTEQTMARYVTDPDARAVLGALWGYLGLPPSRLSSLLYANAVVSYHDYGGWYPQGGAAAISRALVDSLHQRGGEIRFGQRVVTIELSDRLVTSVTTEVGLRVETDSVISDANAPATMLDMVGREHLPADYVARLEAPTPSYTMVNVYLGLDRDVFAEQGLPHEVFVFSGYDHDANEQAALAGDWDHAGITITDYTRVDTGCAPTGHSAVVLSAVAFWGYEDTWGTGGDLSQYHVNPRYLAIKDKVAERLIAVAEPHLPGLESAIRHREVSTPLTNWAYTANPHGAIEGYENTPENSGLGWLPQPTPIRNLFLAGAWTNGGGQNPAMRSGVSAAALALRATPAPAS